MTKHTPGPWHYWNTGYGSSVIESPSHKTLAAIYSEDDARLMTAAPELLKALAAFRDAHDMLETESDRLLVGMQVGCAYEMAVAAIAKAVGHD